MYLKDKLDDQVKHEGRYRVECFDKNGKLKWRDTCYNLMPTQGKNFVLDTVLAGSSYTVVGPFMGLISSTSFSAISVNDTQASHGGWVEAGTTNLPAYSGTRKTVAFSAASGGTKATSAAASFSITTGGTVKGCFIVTGTGAVNTILSTAGFLYSAVLFTGGDKVVSSGDTLNVSYSSSLT